MSPSTINELLSLGFIQRAILAGVIVSILCGTLSVFVVLRRMAFIGVGISHSAFGGVSLGFLLSIDPFWSGLGFSVVVALLIEWTRKGGRIQEDTAIGIFFSASMALGVIFIALSKKYNVDLFGFLFGNILAIGTKDILAISIVGAIVIALVFLFFKEIVYISFDEEMAWLSGIPVSFIQYLFMTLLAVSIIVAIQLIGIVLVSSLLVIPAAISNQLTDKLKKMVILSISTALLGTLGGLFLSYFLDLPSGAVVVMILALIFFFLALWNRFFSMRARSSL